MSIFKKISCLHCAKKFRKREITSDGLCEGCFKHACLLFSIFNYSYKELLKMVDNSNNTDEIFSRYESLFDFTQRELKPWYNYNCLPQITPGNIKTFQDKINHELFDQINVSLDNVKSKSRLSSNYEKHLSLHDENLAS